MTLLAFISPSVLLMPYGQGPEIQLGHATRAEIEAALPSSLARRDAPDAVGEARYRRLAEIASRIKSHDVFEGYGEGQEDGDALASGRVVDGLRPLRSTLEDLLKRPLRVPLRRPEVLFTELSPLRNLGKALALSARDAAARRDRAAAVRWSLLGLSLGQRTLDAGGAVIDALVALSLDQMAVRTVFDIERAQRYDDAGRKRLLAALPPLDGRTPQLGEAIRRDFQGFVMPSLLQPERYFKTDSEFEPPVERAGTFDPVPTARLYGEVYGSEIENSRRRYVERTDQAAKAAERAAKGLPDKESWTRWAMVPRRKRRERDTGQG